MITRFFENELSFKMLKIHNSSIRSSEESEKKRISLLNNPDFLAQQFEKEILLQFQRYMRNDIYVIQFCSSLEFYRDIFTHQVYCDYIIYFADKLRTFSTKLQHVSYLQEKIKCSNLLAEIEKYLKNIHPLTGNENKIEEKEIICAEINQIRKKYAATRISSQYPDTKVRLKSFFQLLLLLKQLRGSLGSVPETKISDNVQLFESSKFNTAICDDIPYTSEPMHAMEVTNEIQAQTLDLQRIIEMPVVNIEAGQNLMDSVQVYMSEMTTTPQDVLLQNALVEIVHHRDFAKGKQVYEQSLALEKNARNSYYYGKILIETLLASINKTQLTCENQSDINSAIQALDHANKLELTNVVYLKTLVEAYFHTDYKQGLQIWEERYPSVKDCEYYNQLGDWLVQNKVDLQQIHRAYQASLDIDPHQSAVYLKLGKIFTCSHQYRKALKFYSTACELEPSNSICQYNKDALEYVLQQDSFNPNYTENDLLRIKENGQKYFFQRSDSFEAYKRFFFS